MIDPNLLMIIFFLPLIILLIPYYRATKYYFKLYRAKKNPNFPLPRETAKYFMKDPSTFLIKLPMTPFIWWKIIFEKHKDPELDIAGKKLRKILLFMFLTMLLNLVFFLVYKF